MIVPEQLRRDVATLTGWIRHVGTALVAITGLMVLVVIGVGFALWGVKIALGNQDDARERDHCTIELTASANADLFDALVELDRSGDISDRSSRELSAQAEALDEIDTRCEDP